MPVMNVFTVFLMAFAHSKISPELELRVRFKVRVRVSVSDRARARHCHLLT